MKYKFKIWEEVLLKDGWKPEFKYTILRRFKHTDGNNMYMLLKNKHHDEAEAALHGTDAHLFYPEKSPIYEGHLEKIKKG